MEKKMNMNWKQRFYGGCITYIWLAGNGGMEKNMKTTIVGYIGTAIRIHS